MGCGNSQQVAQYPDPVPIEQLKQGPQIKKDNHQGNLNHLKESAELIEDKFSVIKRFKSQLEDLIYT